MDVSQRDHYRYVTDPFDPDGTLKRAHLVTFLYRPKASPM